MNHDLKKPNPERFGATDRTITMHRTAAGGGTSETSWDKLNPQTYGRDWATKPHVARDNSFVEAVTGVTEAVRPDPEVNFKFDEDLYVEEILSYIKSTYKQHYAGKYQATDMIIDAGHGEGFTIGSIMKYAKRYGKKDGKNRKDLMKIIHYAIIALHIHDGEPE